MPIAALYAALLTPLFLLLSWRTIAERKEKHVEIGHGEHPELLRRMRVHANFAEYTPLALILLGLAESMAAPGPVLHGIGLVLLAGRHVHAYALSQTPHIYRLRVAGMVATFTALLAGALTCLILALLRLVGG